MTKGIAVVGIGHSKFGKREGVTVREMAFEATKELWDDTGLGPKDVDGSVIGISSEQFASQGTPGAVVVDYVGVEKHPSVRVEAACATGSHAIRTAYGLLRSGLHDKVLVIGVEKMNSVNSRIATEWMARSGDTRWEYPFGLTFPSYYALFATAHMAKYGTTHEQLLEIAVKNHHYGAKNPYAHMQKEITLEKALSGPMIAEPLNLYDCSLITDGAAAVLLTREEDAKQYTDTPIFLRGLGSATDTMSISERKNLTGLDSAKRAGQQAFKMAGITPDKINVAEVHDCFTIAEVMAYEDLGFCKPGEGGKLAEEHQTYIGGKVAVNVDGGLKSKGHPIGATGVSQVVEITKQLRGEAKDRQVNGAEWGLTHNVGQFGQYVNVMIFSR